MRRRFVVAIEVEMDEDATSDDAEAWAAGSIDVITEHAKRASGRTILDGFAHPYSPRVLSAFDVTGVREYFVNVEHRR